MNIEIEKNMRRSLSGDFSRRLRRAGKIAKKDKHEKESDLLRKDARASDIGEVREKLEKEFENLFPMPQTENGNKSVQQLDI